MEPVEFRFKIDAFRPETLPMKRLAEYMSALAELMGETDHVHFKKLARGSAVVVPMVEFASASKVRERLVVALTPQAPADLAEAIQRIEGLLANDNAKATLKERGRRAPLLVFKGQPAVVAELGPVWVQSDAVTGVVVRAGGEDRTSHVTLRDGDTKHNCEVSAVLCQELAKHLYGSPVRLTGRGRYTRHGDGRWIMDAFKATNFEVLDDAPLSEVLARLHPLVEAWGDDALAALRELRDNE